MRPVSFVSHSDRKITSNRTPICGEIGLKEGSPP